MDEIGDDEPDHVGAACDKSSGGEIWAVVQLLDALQDSRPGLLTDVGVIAQSLGNCDYAYTKVPGDVF